MRKGSLSGTFPFPAWGLTAGQFNNVPSTRVPEGGLSASSNVYISEGRIRVRPPLTLYANTNSSTPCNHVAHMITQDGRVRLMRSDLDQLGLISAHAWNGANWAQIGSGMGGSEDHPPGSCMFKGEWLFLPGNDQVYQWIGGSAMRPLSSTQADPELQPPDKPRHISANMARVFLANGIDPNTNERVPWRVWWCSKSDSSTWDHGGRKPESKNASFQDLMHDNTEVTGLHFHDGAEILAFKPRSIYLGVFNGGVALYMFEPISLEVGCIAGRTIQSWNGLCVFLGPNNVYAKPVGSKPTPIGDSIRLRLASCLNSEYAHRSSAVMDPILGVYWLFIPQNQEATCGKIFACSLKDKFAWTEGEVENSTLRVMGSTVYWPTNSDPVLLVASRNGKVYRLGGGTAMVDGDTSYDAHFWSRSIDFMELLAQEGSETASFQRISLQGQSGTATGIIRGGPTVASLEGAEGEEFGDFDMSSQWDQSFRAGHPDAFRFAQVGAYWPPGTANPMTVDGITVWAMPRGDARE